MELIDTHAHLYLPDYANDLAQVIKRTQAAKVIHTCLPNLDQRSILPMLTLTKRDPTYFHPMLGLHPCSLKGDQTDFEQLNYLEKYLSKEHPFIAIGEIGLDLDKGKATYPQQLEVLQRQLDWALHYRLPVVFHCRGAMKQLITLLGSKQYDQLRGVVHCFTGTLQEAQAITKKGFYLGIGGLVSREKSEVAWLVKAIDLAHIVLETDAPYLAPLPHRGSRNEPAYLTLIAKKIASLKQIKVEEVAKMTTSNAKELFGLKVTQKSLA